MSVVDTPNDQVLAAIERVASKKAEWVAKPAADKLSYLYDVRDQIEVVFGEWSTAAAKCRGLENDPVQRDVGAVLGAGILGFHVNGWIETFEAIVATGESLIRLGLVSPRQP